MPIVLITNPKGGCGKSTAATNLAGYFAWRGHATMLGDLDRQQSALAWLGIRPATLPHIQSWDRSDEKIARPPKGVTHVVLDTPAGLRGHALRDVMKLADRVIVPVQPSIFDIYATQAFLAKLADRNLLDDAPRVGILGMRVDARTRAADQLQRFVGDLGLPGAWVPARHAELRSTGGPRAHTVGRRAGTGGARFRAVAHPARVGRAAAGYFCLTVQSRDATVDDFVSPFTYSGTCRKILSVAGTLNSTSSVNAATAVCDLRHLVGDQAALPVLHDDADAAAR